MECCGDQNKESQRLSSGVRGRQRYIAMERKQGLLILYILLYTLYILHAGLLTISVSSPS